MTSTLALESRPLKWVSLVGQDIPQKVLSNSILTNDIKPGYLFKGASGCGKTSAALLFAKRLTCTEPDGADPCNQCGSCRSIDNNLSHDVKYVDGAADRSVAFVRDVLRPFLTTTPIGGKHRIAIIDEAHLYKQDSISAFLTLLEQLPKMAPKSVVILCTTEGDQIPVAIQNRCLSMNFAPISQEKLVEVTHNLTGEDKEALKELAAVSCGSFRTMWSFIEVWEHLGEPLTEEVVMKLIGGVTQDERNKMWSLIQNKRLDQLPVIWQSWLKRGANPNVIGAHLLKDLLYFAANEPNAANWSTAIASLSAVQVSGTESAWLPALYTLCGLPLSCKKAKEAAPEEEQPAPTLQGKVTTRLAFFGA